MTGVIESLEGGILAVSTPIGLIEATAEEDASVMLLSGNAGTLEDITAGQTVSVSIESNDDGSSEAVSVTIIPEELNLPIGAGLGVLGGFGGGQGGTGRPGGAP